jgi:hypothetical protein
MKQVTLDNDLQHLDLIAWWQLFDALSGILCSQHGRYQPDKDQKEQVMTSHLTPPGHRQSTAILPMVLPSLSKISHRIQPSL